ncbi:carboxymuconolactone decarboxylase family protein [Nocardioides sp.]|uniref:carboxymuconolactone decarboxylase family protein n=1 Tax=Nocardioides sp. TaxID=35761 RepID=UPI001993F396|nr:carboxymuconolactone decarboxylase family protein [Nocardioides sp.]MBC7274915.1 carboxymuconolactone decarboxylase family protein [Nocardioides sp.]
MNRLPLIDATSAQPAAKDLLAGVQAALGVTPNMAKALANSPSALKGWVQLNSAVGEGVLPASVRERIAILVAQENGCDYCLSAHTYLATNVAGVSADEAGDARAGKSAEPTAAAALTLAAAIVKDRGDVDDSELAAARAAGLTDEEIAEVVANVALNFFTNIFNRLAHTEIDFPAVRHAE